MPKWWNWYTRNVEVVVTAGSSPVLGTKHISVVQWIERFSPKE